VDTNGFRIVDQSAPFCDAGVEQFDVVQLRGCDPSVGNDDCPHGSTCFVHPESVSLSMFVSISLSSNHSN
jgi:hypothetical protein